MMRGFLATMSGLLVVMCLVTYGGVGINILFFPASRGISSSSITYKVIGICSLVTAICLLGLAFLLLAEFTEWRNKFLRALPLLVSGALFPLLLVHLLALVDLVKVDDLEIRELFINNSGYYALSVLAALILYYTVHWLRVHERRNN